MSRGHLFWDSVVGLSMCRGGIQGGVAMPRRRIYHRGHMIGTEYIDLCVVAVKIA